MKTMMIRRQRGSKLTKNKLSLATSSLLGLSLLGGCTSPSEGVKKAQVFGATATEFRQKTDLLANDIYESCLRKARFYRIYPQSMRPEQAPDQGRLDALTDCETFNRPAAISASNANALIADYVEAIGALADDKQVEFGEQLGAVTNSLNNFAIPIPNQPPITLSPEAINTGAKIANFVFTWAANHYRTGQLSKAMICTDPALQTYSKGLRETYTNGYINGILEQEKSVIRRYFNYYAIVFAKQPNNTAASEALDQSSYNALLPAIQNGLAAQSYLQIIKKTADTNTRIANIFRQSDGSPTNAACQAYLEPPKNQSKAEASSGSSKVFEITQMSPLQKIALAKVIDDYQRDVIPLLQKMKTVGKTH